MRKSNEQSVAEVLAEMLKTFKLKSRLDETRIREIWSEVMGQLIASYTTDIQLRRKKLVVFISSSPLRQELSYGREKIKNNMNQALGESLIEEVDIR
jgi:predicted nucleic acid-binding Zn ribbon protein